MGKKGGKKGGGGMKGFMKQTQHQIEDKSDEETTSLSSSEELSTDMQTSNKSMLLEEPKIDETKSQMRERHKKEFNAAKKNAANMGKKKKKEAAEYLEEIKQRHFKELEKFAKDDVERQESSEIHAKSEPEPEPEPVNSQPPTEKKSKAQKRREKEAQKELERENRIRDEIAEMGITNTELEKTKLESKLKSKGLEIFEVRPDGHCLYKAIEHQMSNRWCVESLRKEAAEELRSSMVLYLPFFVSGEGEDPEEAFLDYCEKVESSAEWGGEMELQALARRLAKTMVIYSADYPDNIIGNQEIKEQVPIRLCLMQHAYHLGAHYNSVIPIENQL